MASFKELRDQLQPEDIIKVLGEYGYSPVYNKETSDFIIFPTCCHNHSGGSPKLYYYKNTHLFKCYTGCNTVFDIFDLIIKIEALRGRQVGKAFAVKRMGFELTSRDYNDLANESMMEDIAKLYELNNTSVYNIDEVENTNLEPINISFLDDRFCFSMEALGLWRKEGISWDTMLRYHITYDAIDNCIIIPHFDTKGNVVGVRGRYLGEDAPAKYKPIIYNGKQLRHPTSKTLYGYYQNREAIERTKSCIIFEGEKSVLKLDTIYGTNNISVATSGQSISNEHIQILLNSKVSNVILAFDADYRTDQEANAKLIEYKKIAKPLTIYFNVSIIMDFKNRLEYKDSPIDKGDVVFKELMKERIYI